MADFKVIDFILELHYNQFETSNGIYHIYLALYLELFMHDVYG